MTRKASNALSPKKLLHTKWTAVAPRNKEKHFLVSKVIEPELPDDHDAMTSREPLDPKVIDEMYGLEPVLEPGTDAASGLGEFAVVQCPYCGESYETAVDLSAGSFRYVEDCQVCCQPIELAGEVDEDGALVGVTAGRG